MSGFSVALKLHTGVISTQYVGPLKAARSREASGVFGSRWRRLPTLLHRVLRRASAYSVCCTRSCRRTHFSSSCSVSRTSFCGGVHITAPAASYAAPAPTLFAAPASVVELHYSGSCSVYGTSSNRGVHRSSGKATPRQRLQCLPHQVPSWISCLQLQQCMLHQLLSWRTSVKRQRQALSRPVVDHISPDSAVYAAPAPVVEYVAPAPFM